MKILHNHIGFERVGPKRAVVRAVPGLAGASFSLISQPEGAVVHEGRLDESGEVDNWRRGEWYFYTLDFSSFEGSGVFSLRIDTSRPGSGSVNVVETHEFAIRDEILLKGTLSESLDYFKTQRCSGQFDRKDRKTSFYGARREGEVDLHGGWYDASGDTSKYLSHLSYANFMNPQQTPLLPWVFVTVADSLAPETHALDVTLRRRLLDEAVHGGDFLVRMQDVEGYFYMTVFDRWSKDLDEREVCAYATQEGTKFTSWESGFRQGGGMAIAALAKLSMQGVEGAFGSARYLETAIRGFSHLEQCNTQYLDDGTENIIDDYCALLAAVELFRATQRDEYLVAARSRVSNLLGRLDKDEKFANWWRADGNGRPYFHAAEAGLPVVSLCMYHGVEPDATRQQEVAVAVEAALRFELDVTSRAVNPFGYARQYVRPLGGERRDAFFIPHENESGYWWQGENARLGSLATAARLGARLVADDPQLVARLERYAQDQLDWILGRNPFDLCMLHGRGRNNPSYENGYPPTCGGVCNGITSGFEDERDIDFAPESCKDRGDQIWRWGEQWLPHAAWYVLAIGCRGRLAAAVDIVDAD
ncbi:MAG: glycoside hydrolase family 9 protein [Nannocystaceae bacterium]